MLNFSLTKIAALVGMFSLTAPVPFANRNGFVDPRLDSWTVTSQALGTGFAYSAATMYIAKAGAGGAGTTSRTDIRANAAVQAVAEASPIFAFTHSQNTASTGTVAAGTAPVTMLQNLEGAGRYSGKSVTLSMKLWLTSGTPITIPQIYAQQVFGTGGSPSAANSFDKAVNWVVSTTPKKFSVRLDVPSVSGKTFGTAGNDCLAIGLWLPPGVTFSLNGLEPQIELCDPNSSSDINGSGGSPTTFEWRGEQPELARVQRFYFLPTNQNIPGTICNGTGNISLGYLPFPVQMRAVPAVGWQSGSFTLQPGGASITGFTLTASTQAFFLSATSSGLTIGFAYQMTGGNGLSADARL